MSDERPFACAECGFKAWLPLCEMDVSWLTLYDDARYPGRCLLVLKQHFEDFAELPVELANRFVADGRHAARAIQRAVSAQRMNYAILGNVEPHVHFHLIPRTPSDPAEGRSPWSTDVPQRPLPDQIRHTVSASILQELRRAAIVAPAE